MTLTFDDIKAAATRLHGHIERTPCRHSRTLSEITGAEVWVYYQVTRNGLINPIDSDDTIIEVDTRDRPGLLYDLTRTLANNNIYIASAVIATYGAQVVDSFYVKDMFGLKMHSKPKQDALEKKLRQAILEGRERATQ